MKFFWKKKISKNFINFYKVKNWQKTIKNDEISSKMMKNHHKNDDLKSGP